jgi:polyribonucleotide nucleotidyltransferase
MKSDSHAPLSSDGENTWIFWLSTPLHCLDDFDILGWTGWAVRIGLGRKFLVHPSIPEMEGSQLDLRVAGTEDAILMVEAGSNEIPEDQMIAALRLAHESIQDVIRVQKEMRAAVGKPKREFNQSIPPEETAQKVMAFLNGSGSRVMCRAAKKSGRTPSTPSATNW